MKFCLKIGCPNYEEAHKWGDYYFARSFGEALARNGHEYLINILPEWDSDLDGDSDVVIHFRGLSRYKVKKQHFNIMWNISHPEKVSTREYRKYDLILVASNAYAEELKKKLKRPVYSLLQFVDQNLFYRDYMEQHKSEILFVGNTRSIYRESVKTIVEQDISIDVYGNGWEKFIPEKYIVGTWFENEQLRKLYSSCKILLNDHWDDMKRYNFINNRFFDAAACGTIIINDYVGELKALFPDAITYSSREELLEVVKDIHIHYEDYRVQASRLQKEVLTKHTVDKRVQEFLNIIKYEQEHHMRERTWYTKIRRMIMNI